MRYRTDLPYRTTVEDVRIPMPDGAELYARIWRPVTRERVPALLEYLPYRLGDWTAPRDAQRHPYYAGHGYASVRVDVRGAGNSDGIETDEYSEQELADGVAVVNWLAEQGWCTGRVGMFGISWGGFNSLQIAALAPEPLKAIVTCCSTDDRYDNDVHYTGGSVLAVDMHAWAATMLAFTSRPPDPKAVGGRWREMWLNRLENLEPFVHTWLAHQTRDDYWRHGSACEDYPAIKAAVLAVGGWHDPYRDTVFRLLENLAGPDRAPMHGLIGPWSHQYPDRGLPPGPSIGFLQETLRWWDRWLKDDRSTGVDQDPKLRAYVSEPVPPATVYETRPGRWVGADSWPTPDVVPSSYRLGPDLAPAAPPVDGFVAVASPQQTGVDAGRFFPFGNDSDLPPDQREEDGRSVCFDSAPLEERIEILGRARVRLRLRCAGRRGQVIARLCDVAPDGASTLVTRGVLNLSARHGRDRAEAWEPGAVETVEFELNAVGQAFEAGHRLRLAVSNAYWPWVWPQREDAELGVDVAPESGSALVLPVRDPAADAHYPPIAFEEPEQAEPLAVTYGTPAEPRPERRVVRDVAEGEWLLEVDPNYGGSRTYPDGLVFTESALERYWITEGDPLSARTRSDWFVRLERADEDWDASIRTRSEIACDEAAFHTVDSVEAREGETVVFSRTWERTIPRTAG